MDSSIHIEFTWLITFACMGRQILSAAYKCHSQMMVPIYVDDSIAMYNKE